MIKPSKDPHGLAILIASKRPGAMMGPMGGEDDGTDDAPDEQLEAVAQDILHSIRLGDAGRLASSLKDFFELVDEDAPEGADKDEGDEGEGE